MLFHEIEFLREIRIMYGGVQSLWAPSRDPHPHQPELTESRTGQIHPVDSVGPNQELLFEVQDFIVGLKIAYNLP